MNRAHPASPLGLGVAALLLVLTPGVALAARAMGSRSVAHVRPAAAPPTLSMVHLTTHATYQLRPDGRTGGISGQAMKAVTQLMRCHHTGKRHAISPRLVEILYATARHFHSGKLYVVAGYRAPAIARKKGNPKSAHKRGVACDFRLEGVAIESIRDYLKAKYSNIGLGYYPNSGFIHVDVGRRRFAQWTDYSGPGESARYGRPAVELAASNSDDRTE